jgi:hypothetical protein
LQIKTNDIAENYLEQKSDFVFIDPADSFWKDRTLYLTDLMDTHAVIVRHDLKNWLA